MPPTTDLQPYAQRLASGTVTKDDLRGERDVILDLYKHHLKLLLEANVFVYAVTGALLSFVIAHLEIPHIRWVLAFPVVFDAAFAVFFWVTGNGIDYNEKELDLIASALNINVVPRLDALKLGLRVSSTALAVVAVLVAVAAFLM
jgi:hypothetical protein